MQDEAARAAESREWLAKALLDLRAAEFEFGATPPLTGDIVFHCQQVAEKSLKGFLAWHDEPFRKTHNLVEVGEQCVALDPTLENVARRAATLTDYAWRFRYPASPKSPPWERRRKRFYSRGRFTRKFSTACQRRLDPERRRRSVGTRRL